jgi:hypothetical protein
MDPSPYLDVVRKDQLEQALARLSLEDIDHQFPIALAEVTSLGGGSTTTEKIALNYLKKFIRQIGMKDKNMMYRLIKQYVGKEIPTAEIEKGFAYPETTAIPILSYEELEPHATGKLFDISNPLSTGTAQGTTYNIEIHPNANLHIVSLLSQAFGIRENIPAVMKKSPIYDPRDWLEYILLLDMIDNYDIIQSNPNFYYDIKELVKKYIDERYPSKYMMADRAELAEEARFLQNYFIEIYNAAYNEAYVDALGYYLGSLLTEFLLTPFFPLFYASFRAFDKNYFGPEYVQELGPRVNENFPVEVVVMQPLRENLKQIIRRDGFFTRDGDRFSGYSQDKMMSMFAQIVFGLSVAQAVFGIVNNDFHAGNLMYEQVPEAQYLYYYAPDTKKYWRVPTFGRVFKMIDFGRASFRFGTIEFASPTQDQAVGGGINLFDPNNDLYRITSFFVRDMGWKNWLDQPPLPMRGLTDLLTMLRTILRCDGETVFTKMSQCNNPSEELKREVEGYRKPFTEETCHGYAIQKWPYLYGSKCKHAIPSKNLGWFARYSIRESEVPKDAIVYSVL